MATTESIYLIILQVDARYPIMRPERLTRDVCRQTKVARSRVILPSLLDMCEFDIEIKVFFWKR